MKFTSVATSKSTTMMMMMTATIKLFSSGQILLGYIVNILSPSHCNNGGEDDNSEKDLQNSKTIEFIKFRISKQNSFKCEGLSFKMKYSEFWL